MRSGILSSSPGVRPTWDETWLGVAQIIARRSLCVRDQVGAVIVNEHNRIVATGYNGPPATFSANGPCTNWCKRSRMAQQSIDHGLALDYTDCPSLHAEANALSVCDRSLRERGTIYVTSAICMGCAKLIANSGLWRVVIDGGTQELAPHRNAEASYEFLRKCGVRLDFK